MNSVKLYRAWQNMKQRCKFEYTGISVCNEWRDSFETFSKDMGEPPSDKHTLERVDNNGDYCKDNCIWATRAAQNKNKGDTRIVELFGYKQCIADWCRELGINANTVRNRISKGMSPEDALTTPISGKGGWGLK